MKITQNELKCLDILLAEMQKYKATRNPAAENTHIFKCLEGFHKKIREELNNESTTQDNKTDS